MTKVLRKYKLPLEKIRAKWSRKRSRMLSSRSCNTKIWRIQVLISSGNMMIGCRSWKQLTSAWLINLKHGAKFWLSLPRWAKLGFMDWKKGLLMSKNNDFWTKMKQLNRFRWFWSPLKMLKSPKMSFKTLLIIQKTDHRCLYWTKWIPFNQEVPKVASHKALISGKMT